MSMSRIHLGALAVAAAAAISSTAPSALACGGFFCSQSQPVNQAAERIVFSDNGDGTVTAVIQIMYEGPSESFSWLLPIPTVPDPESDEIAVASDIAFQRLQNATNPTYSLTTQIEGQCETNGFGGRGVLTGSSNEQATPPSDAAADPTPPAVTVEASGVVGSFEWTVISLVPGLDDPADAATMWLTDNGYDVTDGAAELIGPYLEEGLYLLALRLVKGADTGSIRPIVLTYDAGLPSIPIKLTAVAANDDMGVMTWIASDARAVPENYLSLELNEARINWFNASSNYADVVNQAADEAGGQGFVTEAAFTSTQLSQAVWTSTDELTWNDFSDRIYSSFAEMFSIASTYYGAWDGFWDAVQASVTLPEGVAFEDFKLCPNCYDSDIEFSPSVLLENMESFVVQPVRLVQELLDGREYVTRLYTTMSAEEMTLDPVFTFNEDLPEVSNVHTAVRVIECNPDVSQAEAPWRIELPNGDVVRGEGQNLTWPEAFDEQPANLRLLQLSSSGEGMVIEDNTAQVSAALTSHNDAMPQRQSSGGGCSVAMPARGKLQISALLSLFGLALLLSRRRIKVRASHRT